MPLPSRREMANVVTAGMNTMVMPETTPGSDSGMTTRANTVRGGAPRSSAALDDAAVHLLHHGVDGQDHEGQKVIDHAQKHRRLRADEVLARQAPAHPAPC